MEPDGCDGYQGYRARPHQIRVRAKGMVKKGRGRGRVRVG